MDEILFFLGDIRRTAKGEEGEGNKERGVKGLGGVNGGGGRMNK